MLVLAVYLDEVIAEPFEQTDRHRGVVDEGAVAARAGELAAHEDLAVIDDQPRLLEDRGRGVAVRPRTRLHGRRLGTGPDHIGLGTGTADHAVGQRSRAGQQPVPNEWSVMEVVVERGAWRAGVNRVGLDFSRASSPADAGLGGDAAPGRGAEDYVRVQVK